MNCSNKKKIVYAATLAFGIAGSNAWADPLKIGLVETLSGPQASTGMLFRTAVRYSVNQINAAGGWNGEPVQLLEYDNQGGPVGASDKLKAAIADGVQLVIQGASSSVGGQITEGVRKHNLRNPGDEVIYLNVGAEALELTGEKCHFHHFRFNPNAKIRTRALVGAMKEVGALGSRVYSINQNYSWGQDMENAISENAALGGYEVAGKVLHDTNKIQDFSPYVVKIRSAQVDSVITGNWSNDLLLLMKSAKNSGLNVRFGTAFLDQPGNVANAGSTAQGHFVAHAFNAEATGDRSEKFALEYKSKTGHMPAFIEPQTVFALSMIGKVLKDTKADEGRLNVNSFALKLENAVVSTPMGDSKMRASDHQLLMPIVVSTVSMDAKFKADGTEMGFKPVKLLSADEAAIPVQDSCTMKLPI